MKSPALKIAPDPAGTLVIDKVVELVAGVDANVIVVGV